MPLTVPGGSAGIGTLIGVAQYDASFDAFTADGCTLTQHTEPGVWLVGVDNYDPEAPVLVWFALSLAEASAGDHRVSTTFDAGGGFDVRAYTAGVPADVGWCLLVFATAP